MAEFCDNLRAERPRWDVCRAISAAFFAICVLLLSGCLWPRRAAPTIPSEIARCRELTEQGTLAMQQGETTLAEDQFRNALQANPADVDARRLFAETLWTRHASPAAIAQMEIASQLAPHDSALTVRVGEMLLASGDLDGALAEADRAIAANSHFGPAWALRGRAHKAARRHDRAVADLQRALIHSPSDKDVLLELGSVYLEKGQPRRCLTTIHQLLDLCPPSTEPQRALFLEGQAYLSTGRPADAVDSLHAATLRGMPTAEIYYGLARAEAECGHTVEAIRAAQSALAAEPTHFGSRELLADLGGATSPPSTVLR